MQRNVFLALVILASCFSINGNTKTLTVFDVQKRLALKDSVKEFKDFYINGGSADGLREGMIITVTRRRSLYDAYQNNSPEDLIIPVGQLLIIHTQKDVSVARLYRTTRRSDTPLIEFEGIMVGDQLDIATARMRSKKRRVSKAPKPTPRPSPSKSAEGQRSMSSIEAAKKLTKKLDWPQVTMPKL